MSHSYLHEFTCDAPDCPKTIYIRDVKPNPRFARIELVIKHRWSTQQSSLMSRAEELDLCPDHQEN